MNFDVELNNLSGVFSDLRFYLCKQAQILGCLDICGDCQLVMLPNCQELYSSIGISWFPTENDLLNYQKISNVAEIVC